jgi:tRNA A37 N6-isopentenylltransferase MiaA
MTAKIIEVNAPAYLAEVLTDIEAMLNNGLVEEARALVRQAREVAVKQLHWFQRLQWAQIMLPEGYGWTDEIHRDNSREEGRNAD